MKKKNLFLLTAALVSIFMFAGCEKTAIDNAEYTQAANGNEVITVITRETAMLASAGSQQINAKDVTFTSVNLNSGESNYEVEFIYEGYKYKVDIDAESGDVKNVVKEVADQPVQSETAENDIGRDNALKAALNKAGLADVSAEQLERLFVELDRDDGKLEYDIDFRYDGIKYEVTVSAADGSILDFEKEFKENKPSSDNSEADTTGYITKEEALAIALDHAQLTESDIVGLRIELDEDDGKMEYDVEFVSNYTEYDYDINAKSGEIRNFDRDGEHVSAPEFSQPSKDDMITYDDAKAAALVHAGVTEESVYDFDIELDKDDGVMKYEIEFKSGKYEYEYDINALDGAVIRYEKDTDD